MKFGYKGIKIPFGVAVEHVMNGVTVVWHHIIWGRAQAPCWEGFVPESCV